MSIQYRLYNHIIKNTKSGAEGMDCLAKQPRPRHSEFTVGLHTRALLLTKPISTGKLWSRIRAIGLCSSKIDLLIGPHLRDKLAK